MNRRRLYPLLAVVLTVAGLVPAGAAAARTAGPPPEPPHGQSIEDVAGRVQQRAAGSAALAAVQVAADGRTVQVFTTDTSEAFRRSLIGTDPASGIVFRAVTHNAAELDALQDRIRADEPALRAHGVHLVSVFPAPEIDGLKVTVEHLTPAVRTALQSRYHGIASIVEGRPMVSYASRLNDAAPWNGGDVLSMDNGGDCTSGPGVVDSAGRTLMLTAGHCFIEGTAGRTGYVYRVFQKSHFVGGDTNTAAIGMASAERTTNGYDVATIDARSFGHDWRTAQLTDNSTAVRQAAVGSGRVGLKMCVSGAFSGENCNAQITSAGGTIWVGGVPFIHMVEATNPGVVLSGPGDSGAPVYEVHSSGLFIFGMLLGGTGGLDCQYYNNIDGRPGNCGDTIAFQDMTSIAVHLHVSLYTP
jgi:hypothetical protein